MDAIVGARQVMHSILDAECNGCALCLPVCPVDCIALVPASTETMNNPWPDYSQAEADHWRTRVEARRQRLRKKAALALASKKPRASDNESERIRAEIRAAVTRVRAKKSARRSHRS